MEFGIIHALQPFGACVYETVEYFSKFASAQFASQIIMYHTVLRFCAFLLS
jgi:hypothetical protein